MIRLLEDENSSNLKLYDVVSYAGYDWYVIYIDDEDAHLLAKDRYFGNHIFGKGSNNYKTSATREYLKTKVLPALIKNGANPISTNLPDVRCTDKVYLLSVEEAEKLPIDIRKFPSRWWLRSHGYDKEYVAYVSADGDVYDNGYYVNYVPYALRPAIIINRDELLK